MWQVSEPVVLDQADAVAICHPGSTSKPDALGNEIHPVDRMLDAFSLE